MRGGAPVAAALAAGSVAGFTAAVWTARAIRPALLIDPDPQWAAARLVLTLAVAAAAAGAAGLVSGALLWSSRRASFGGPLEPLPFSRGTLAGIAAAALLFGLAARAAWIAEIPWPLWVDDLSLLGPTLSLEGSWRDFSDPVRAAPFGVPRPFGTVGVGYLEIWRLALKLTGTTVCGIRLPSLAAGVLSLLTAGLLGRSLLPRGGGVVAVLVLAGMRWSLILSRWGWVAIAVAPLLDAAALLLLRARRRGRPALAAGAGLVAGFGAHVYLSAWVGGAALLLFALWPEKDGASAPERARLAGGFAAGFALCAAPLFLAGPAESPRYFERAADHNLLQEVQRTGSAMPVLSAAADALASPWLVADPTPRHDIPGRSRLGWVLGIPVAAILLRSLVVAREELSAWLLAHAAAAFAAALAAGQATLPNGFRYGYLTTVTAVAAAGGVLWLLDFTRPARRRVAALAALGALGLAAVLGARDTLRTWGESRETFDAFHGEDTLIGRAAARWDRRGAVDLAPDLGFDPRTHSPITIRVVRDRRLEPGRCGSPEEPPVAPGTRSFRIVAPSAALEPGERVVERVRDGWGRDRAVVYGRRTS